MMEDAAEIVGVLAKKAAAHLFAAIIDDQHDLNNCSDEVKELLKRGGEQIQDERYEDAVRSFEEASKLDPQNVSAKIRLLKVYKHQGKDLTALVIGGGALNLAVEPKAQSQVFCFLGDICVNIFESTKSLVHIEEAISFYNNAMDANAGNIHPLWNRAQAYMLYQKFATDAEIGEDAGRRAKSSIDAVIRMGDSDLGNSRQYWRDLVADAETGGWWPNGEYWDEKLGKMRSVLRKFQITEVDNGGNVGDDGYSFKNRKIQKLKAGLIAASMILSLLGWAAFPSEVKGMESPSSIVLEETTHTYTVFPESQAGTEYDWNDLVGVEPHWDDLAAIEPHWNDLA